MEPTTLATATIIALFTSEAVKAGGKALGEGTSKLVGQLFTLIRNKFKASKAEGVLTIAEEEPTEENIDIVRTVLLNQIKKDEEFADQLRELLATPEAQERIRQVVVEGSKADSLNAKDLIQDIKTKDAAEQSIVSDSEIGSINLEKVKQVYRHDS
jgi:hypothetical protein